MYSFFVRCIRTLGNALLYGTIFSFIIGGTVYAMAGTRLISLAGIDFVDFFTQGQGNGTAGVNASALHTSRNDTWIPFPGDNQNYIRGTTNFQYGNVNVADSLCLGGVCRNNWGYSGHNCRRISSTGGPPNYMASISCASDEYMQTGGGYCENRTPIGVPHHNAPTSNNGWAVDCYNVDQSGENIATAVIICCK